MSAPTEAALLQQVRGKSKTQQSAERISALLALAVLTTAIFAVDHLLSGLEVPSSGRSTWSQCGGLTDSLLVGACLVLPFLYCVARDRAKQAAAIKARPVKKAPSTASSSRSSTPPLTPPQTRSPAGTPASNSPRTLKNVTQHAGKLVVQTAIEAAAREGDAMRAAALLDEFEDASREAKQLPDANLYLMVVRAWLKKDELRKATNLMDHAEKIGIETNTSIYNAFMDWCGKQKDLRGAEKWLARMEARGLKPTQCSFNTIMDACAKANDMEGCEAWMMRMTQAGYAPNEITYATTIYARARRGDEVGAASWLRHMEAAGVQPDAVSYNSLIHACRVKGNITSAEYWVSEMVNKGIEPSVTTYTTVIDICAKVGEADRAEWWLNKMVDAGITPNVVSYSAVIDSCAKAGDLQRAEAWLHKMHGAGVQPNAHSYSAVINACAKAGDVDKAERWLILSQNAGVATDAVLYSGVIDACGKANDTVRALKIFNQMRTNGIKPHIVAYAALARPFAYKGDWAMIEEIAAWMSAEGTVINDYFLYAQILAYGTSRPREPQRAEEAFRAAMKIGLKANDHIASALSRAVGRERCGELLTEFGCAVELPKNPRDGQRQRPRGPHERRGAC
eukprot:gnl/TRDRNA2_/TRDRNA2_84528_c0_seq1.p1 gnl/TRDRNA2_/TRDRNA2_84528_c0~~gnl/TRDRNA2_/TRDRNA2_84528_c0_seq1.p1  ORF type:complete len:622 (+),score=121.91 gnl/TRDRNA2_/TRDRNA2_84528_c0_seq1:140-2005(+)